MTCRRVLVTRPKEDSEELTSLIQSKGYNVDSEPFLKIVYHDVEFSDLDIYDALIFTSRNAVRSFCKNSKIRDIDIYVVGEASADLAHDFGFQKINMANGGVETLEELLANSAYNKTLYVRGKHISRSLKSNKIDEIVAYHTEKVQKISSDVLEHIMQGQYSAIIFMSIRTAESCLHVLQCHKDLSQLKVTRCLCLSDSIARVVSNLPWHSICVAKKPNKQAILDLLD